jgi:carboxyl-terminal processing protease
MMKKISLLIAITIATLIVISSCKKDENPNLYANEQLLLVMENYYLWYDKLPKVKPESFPSPVEMLEALRYKQLDRWSYITTKAELDAYFQGGEYVGYGIGLAFDSQDKLWLTFVFNNSPFREVGADRGWRISAINGTIPTRQNANSLFSTNSATFTLVNHNEQVSSVSLTKRIIIMNTVLMDTVYTSSKIGYFVLNSFINPTVNELNAVFTDFKAKGVADVIVDLRYNGGGSVATAIHLSNLLAGLTSNNLVLGTYVHNDKLTSENKSIYIKQDENSIDLSRVVFITSKQSASASELIINGLKPHMTVKLVGDDTYGKPVGMYTFTSESPTFKWAFVPICFKILNANGEGDYYDGLPVDIEATDGINIPFGEITEPSLNAAISYLEGSKIHSSVREKVHYPKLKGLQSEIGAW